MTTTTTSTDDAEAQRVQFDRLALGLRTATPGIVVAVDPSGRWVDVQPAVSLVQRLEDTQTLPMPVVRRVPLHVYGSTSLGLFVCAPVAPGDDGLLIASDRALDNWQFGAGVDAPPDAASPRHHDITDVVFVPGLQRDSTAIPSYPTAALELRTQDGTTKISIAPGAITLRVGAFVLGLTAAGLTIDGHPYLAHTHTGVSRGGAATDPVTP